MKAIKIEVDFPFEVEISGEHQENIARVIGQICQANETDNIRLWPASFGSKPIFIPLTAEEEKERGIEFDDSIFHIGCGAKQRLK